jgi:hypothetical protein
MSEHSAEILSAVRDIRNLLELMAEPAIAQRDAKLRRELRQIVGGSKPKQKAVLLMNGARRQKDIQDQTSINSGHLSTLVGKLNKAKLLVGDLKLPRLVISIPTTFFDSDAEAE